MPRGKKNKKTKKKNYKKNKVSRPILSGFPSRKLVKLRYTKTNVTLDPGAGLTASYTFRANSVFDPDFSGVGTQPMAFDQWASIYERYCVVGARMKIYITPAVVNNNGNPCYMGITLGPHTDNLSRFTTIANILESKHTRGWQLVNNSNTVIGRSGMKTLSRKFSAKKAFGITNVLDDSDYGAAVSANPANQHYFQVWAASIGGNDPSLIDMTVMIDYIVMFQDPKILDGS